MNYPFEFEECLLDDTILDALGFSEYWGGCGDYGERRLHFNLEYTNDELIWLKDIQQLKFYEIIEIDAQEDDCYGYGSVKTRIPRTYYNTKTGETLYFLHDLYLSIKQNRLPKELDVFIKLCESANLSRYIKSFIEYEEKIKIEIKGLDGNLHTTFI